MNNYDSKNLVNRVCELAGEDMIYHDLIHQIREDYFEEDELFLVLSRNVESQMQSKSHLKKEEDELITDLFKGRYKGKDEHALEEYRLEALSKIREEKDPLKKVDILREYGRELKHSIEMLDFQRQVNITSNKMMNTFICASLIRNGLSLTQIKKYVPWVDSAFIYGGSILLDKKLTLSDEELNEVRQDYNRTGEPVVLNKVFGEPERTQE